MITTYKTIQLVTNDCNEFDKIVNQMINDGYQPKGNTIMMPVMQENRFNPGEPTMSVLYSQTMVKYEETPDFEEITSTILGETLRIFADYGIIDDEQITKLKQDESIPPNIDAMLDEILKTRNQKPE